MNIGFGISPVNVGFESYLLNAGMKESGATKRRSTFTTRATQNHGLGIYPVNVEFEFYLVNVGIGVYPSNIEIELYSANIGVMDSRSLH